MEIPSVQALKSITALAEKREKLLAEVAEIEAKLKAAMGGQPTPAKKGRKPKKVDLPADFNGQGPPAKPAIKVKARGRRGGIKESIVAALEAAGESGVRVVELAEKLGMKSQNAHVWFSTTGKKLTTKLAPGVYALKKSGSTPTPATEEETPVANEVTEKPAKLAKTVKSKAKKAPKKK